MRRAVRTRKRMGALFMSAALAMAQLPMVTMAKGSPPEDGSIASFAALERSAARQEVEAGTAYEDLILPGTVTASVYHVTENAFIPDEDADGETNSSDSLASPGDAAEKASDSNAGHSSGKDDREPDVIITVSEEEIPVEWKASPAYAGDIPGEYVFTAEVTGYVMSDRATAPQITVTVLPKQPVNNTLVRLITDWTFVATDYSDYAAGELVLGGVSAENQMDFDAVAGMLPKQISVEIQEESDSATLDIPQWLCPEYRQDSEGNWPVSGSYTFTAVLPEGYDLAEGAARPEITVLVGGANVLSGKEEFDGLTIVADSGSVNKDTEGSIVLESGSFTITGIWKKTDTGTIPEAVIVVKDGAKCDITLNKVTIEVGEDGIYGAFVIKSNAEVTLTLSDESKNILKSGGVHAGLEVGENSTLTINGSGTVDATGGGEETGGAGIGGESGHSAGTIIIESGTIIATGINNAAGIGGGGNGQSGSITINGGTVEATAAEGGAGIGGGDGGEGDVTINGGTIIAESKAGAGIGGGFNKSGNVTITGGRITAVSELGAGIGPGEPYPDRPISAAGTVTISGGMVTADSKGQSAAGIGGDKVDFSTGNEGNAVIIANSIVCKDEETSRNNWRGLIIEGNSGKLYSEEVVLTQDLEIGDGVTITVEAGKTLTVDENVTLTNKGTIIIDEGGTLNNLGIITGGGNITGNYNDKKSEVQLSASDENPAYGDTITLTATITEKTPAPANSRVRLSTPVKTVLFYRDNDEIGRVTVDVDTGTGAIEGSLEVKLEGQDWTIGQYTLTAKYTGSNEQLLSSESDPLTLTVKKRSQNTPSAPEVNGEPSDTTVTLNTASGQKYACTDSEIKPAIGGDIWKEATGETLLFSDLNSNTNYYFWTYIPGDTYCNDSPVSDFTRITTDKNSDQKAIDAAKAAIESGSYAVAQSDAEAEEALKTALSKQINDLDGVKNNITVEPSDITINAFKEATVGDADEPAGTNGSFAFTVVLAKGKKTSTTAGKTGTITATPFTGKTNAKAVEEARAAIEGGSYTVSQADAGTEETLKTALSKQLNDLGDVKNNDITVKSSDIMLSAFKEAIAGNAGSSDGTSGSFTFTAALSKGSATVITASKTGTITATPYVSSDATLSSLSVEGAAISPAFNPAIDSYTASVGYGVSNVTVTATAADGRAKVSGDIGTKSLQVGSNTFTVTVTAEDGSKRTYTVTITRAAYSGGGGSSGNRDHSSSSGSGNSVTIQTSTGPEIPTTGITPPVTPDKDGSVTFREDTISAAISAAKQNARSRGSMKNGIAVTVPANTVIGQTVFRAVIPTSVLDKLIAEQVARFDITTNNMISFSFTLDTLKQLRTYAEGGQIIFVAKKESGLTGSVLDAIGSRPAYDIGIFYPKDGNKVPITTLNGNTVTVKLSYIPEEGEDTGHLYAVYVDDAKTVHWLETSIYDPSQKAMIFEAAYFNIYGVGSRPAPDYMDTLNH